MTGYHRNAWDIEALLASADGFSWSLIDANFLVPLLQCIKGVIKGLPKGLPKASKSDQPLDH